MLQTGQKLGAWYALWETIGSVSKIKACREMDGDVFWASKWRNIHKPDEQISVP